MRLFVCVCLFVCLREDRNNLSSISDTEIPTCQYYTFDHNIHDILVYALTCTSPVLWRLSACEALSYSSAVLGPATLVRGEREERERRERGGGERERERGERERGERERGERERRERGERGGRERERGR